MSNAKIWTCPHCNHKQTSTLENRWSSTERFAIGENKFEACGIYISAIACLNPDCKEVTINSIFGKISFKNNYYISEVMDKYSLRPKGSAKPQPNYIPQQIIQDYQEACLIRDLSPKASATLSRRCIQGMIRNFCGITKNRLIDELNELERLVNEGMAPKGVTEETVEAINTVRSMGNIGAHMEKDINTIIEIDENEAGQLIQLIEHLFEDWYVARESRRINLENIKLMKQAKGI